jgi:radical SAM protein with 4Fe4S-binding SPASM domain
MTSLSEHIEQRYLTERRIYAVLMELTKRCPADCIHCYVIKNPINELSLAEICDYFAQFRAEGVFNLTLSGGDPLVRPDIAEILAEARRHHFFTSVQTSGLPVTAKQADLMARHGVNTVEMSMLGDNAATHDAVMQFTGAFAKLENAVRLLRDRGVGVVLKATLMKPNHDELSGMAELARRWGARFNASVSLVPRHDGNCQPLDLALTQDQVADLDPKLVAAGLIPGEDYSGGGLITCRAGMTIAAVNAVGEVFPCVVFPAKVGSLRERTLQQIWHDYPDPFLLELRSIKAPEVQECFHCDLRSSCRRCPGGAWLETGKLRTAAPSDCAVAEGLARGIARLKQSPDSRREKKRPL